MVDAPDSQDPEKREPATRLAIDDGVLVEPIEGEVAIVGPQHLAGSLTPDAADHAADQLRDAAAVARGHVPAK